MHEAKVVIIEDNEDVRLLARTMLKLKNHHVVGEAGTLQQAISIIDQVANGDLEVDVYLLDGNLREESMRGEDAQIISQHMRARKILGHIIGFSQSELPPDVCDSVAKNKNMRAAVDIINELPDKN